MRQSYTREVLRVSSVVAAVTVTALLGDTTASKMIAAVLASAAALGVESLLLWAPRRSELARRWLDPHAVWLGTWVQVVKHVRQDGGSPTGVRNALGLFRVVYDQDQQAYVVRGLAFDAEGRRHSEWRSAREFGVVISKSGFKMSYDWQGRLLLGDSRSGLTYLVLDDVDSGSGRVDHVAMRIEFEFDVYRLTAAWLAKQGVEGVDVDQIHGDASLEALAQRLAPALAADRHRTTGEAGAAADSGASTSRP